MRPLSQSSLLTTTSTACPTDRRSLTFSVRVQAISDEAQRRAEAAALLGVLRRFVEIDEELSRMSGIEAAMAAALPQASPKTREGFAILRRMIEDTRALYRESVPSRHALDQAIALLKG